MFKNFFKKSGEPKVNKEVETAVVLVMHADGGPTIPILKVEGVPQRRPATMNDLYRMVSEVKRQVEDIMTADRVLHALMPAPQVQPEEKPVAPVVKSEAVNESAQKVEQEKK